jgi:hypothetical protein
MEKRSKAQKTGAAAKSHYVPFMAFLSLELKVPA